MSKDENLIKKEISKEVKMFKYDPIWKTLLRMALPSMILMLVLGSYFFFDSVLSINLASDEYADQPILVNNVQRVFTGTEQVRVFMQGYSPVNALMMAVTLLFGMGVATRVSINMGANRKDRAINTIRVGTMFSMSLSIIMVPILIFTAKPWIASQYPDAQADFIADQAFKYAWPVIISLPFMMFNQVISSLFRAEARNKEMMIAMILPIFINLGLDAILMGPAGMGVEGGAWATFTANAITTLFFVIMIIIKRESLIIFKNMFGLRMRMLAIVGIILVGIAPFMRNFAQSITSTVQMQVIKDVSVAVYKNPLQMTNIITGAMPVFTLFFPVMFSFAAAARPVASFNYGAKEYGRVRQTYWYTILFATLAAIIIYFLVAWGISNPLMRLLKMDGINIEKAENTLKIIMIAMITFGPAIGAMVIFGSTDRIFLSIIASSLQGLIVFWPAIFIMKEVAINNPNNEFIFWWYWPISSLMSSLVLIVVALFTMRSLNMKGKVHKTLDEKISRIIIWIEKKLLRKRKHDDYI